MDTRTKELQREDVSAQRRLREYAWVFEPRTSRPVRSDPTRRVVSPSLPRLCDVDPFQACLDALETGDSRQRISWGEAAILQIRTAEEPSVADAAVGRGIGRCCILSESTADLGRLAGRYPTCEWYAGTAAIFAKSWMETFDGLITVTQKGDVDTIELRALASLLRPGGRLLIVSPCQQPGGHACATRLGGAMELQCSLPDGRRLLVIRKASRGGSGRRLPKTGSRRAS